MDGCIIESNSIIGNGSVVLEGTHVETGLYLRWESSKKNKEIRL